MATARFKKSFIAAVIATSSLWTGTWRAEADAFVQTNLVSNIPGFATLTDPNLVNPWGVSHLPASPFWVSDQSKNVSTLYNVTGSTNVAPNPLVVSIPTTAAGPQGPTGQVSNTNAQSFLVNGVVGAPANFIFANLNGTISARNAGNAAFIQATTTGAVYTGLAINQAGTQLYAANGAQNRIDVFSSTFALTNVPGTFVPPPSIPANFVPFNVQALNGEIYVTYAPAVRTDQQHATPGMGAVAVFNESGGLLRTMNAAQIMAAGLAAPWGVTLAPAGFGPFGGDLLVGNFSFDHSLITALDPITFAFLGTIMIDVGGNTPGGLWFIGFGQGGNNGSPNTLYFTDGINGERDGLFGAINPVPLPAALPLFATGLGALGLLGWRRKRRLSATS